MKAKIIGGSAAAVLLLAMAFVKPLESRGGAPDLVAYRDIVGVWTNCHGNTKSVDPRRRMTVAECERILSEDMAGRLDALSACIVRPLTVDQYAAVLSWAYNVGTRAACGSTLVKKINAGSPPSVWCAELSKWVYAGGKRVQGLANRRAAERALCEGRS